VRATKIIHAPFRVHELRAIRRWQVNRDVDRYTCSTPECRDRLLDTRADALVCPGCGRRQEWFDACVLDGPVVTDAIATVAGALIIVLFVVVVGAAAFLYLLIRGEL
jgi:hypothetical protein